MSTELNLYCTVLFGTFFEENIMSQKVWYIEAHDVHTNERIAEELGFESAHKGLLCRDGTKRDMWECTYDFVSKLIMFRESARLKFTVFYRESRHGPIKPWPFATKKRMTLAQALKKGTVRQGA